MQEPQYAEASRGPNQSDSAVDQTCEDILISPVAGDRIRRQNAAMSPTPKVLPLLALSWVCLMLPCALANASQDTLKVLILNSYDESSAPYFQTTEVFKTKLQERRSALVAFRHVDLRQRGIDAQPEVDDSTAELILASYADTPPDLILAAGPPAIDFWIRYRASTFPDSPLVAMARESYLQQVALQPGDARIATEFSFTAAVDNIVRLLPQVSRIIMVFGDSRSERTLSEGARQQLDGYSDRLTLEFTNDLTVLEIQDLLAGLTEDAAVFFGIFSADVEGVSPQRFSGLTMVRSASRAPVFGAFDDQLGNGIVGGSLIQIERVGNEMAEAAQALLTNEHRPGEMIVVPLSTPRYDWRELTAWNIDSDRLPQGSEILFEPPGFWKTYAGWILFIAIVLAAQAAGISTLLIQRHKRRQAELAHASLGRRLITAHEDERRLLARELHDDLSQRLARVAIDAGFIRSVRQTDEAEDALLKLHAELASISKDVHDMSYRLHPSLVDDLGVVAALQSELERVQRQVDVRITAQIRDVRHTLTSETALCVFRIAQEALQNAVKHAQASEIEVILDPSERDLLLSVHDNGVGFDLTMVSDRFSLGLSSMRERAAVVGGELTIRSRPGSGTTVSLVVPIDGMKA